MAVVIDTKVGMLVSITDQNDNEENWQKEYLNLSGVMLIFRSEKKSPGKHFIEFFPYEDSPMQRYMKIAIGDIEMKDDYMTLKTAYGSYCFLVSDNLLEESMKREIIMNIMVNY